MSAPLAPLARRGDYVRTGAYNPGRRDGAGPLVHRSSGRRNSRTGRNVRALCGVSCDPRTWIPDAGQAFRVCGVCDAVLKVDR